MAVVITDILGTDAISGSRLVINANFQSIKDAIDTIETNLGISTASGNIDVSGGSGGQVKAKSIVALNGSFTTALGVPTITLTGATGALTATSLTSTSFTTNTAVIETAAFGGTGGSVSFGGGATFNDVLTVANGLAYNLLDLGAVTTHTVLNDDRVLVFDSSTTLTLTADAALVDGHVVTLVNKSSSGTCTLDTTLILGFGTGSITFSGGTYKSSIELMYSVSNAKWIVIGSSNMTIA